MADENEERNTVSQVRLFHLKVGSVLHELNASAQVHFELVLPCTEKAHSLAAFLIR